jgi:hypothetical protein
MMAILLAMFGLIPAAMASGIGSDVQRPLATVIVGGLLFKLILTLLVMPSLSILLERKKGEILLAEPDEAADAIPESQLDDEAESSEPG